VLRKYNSALSQADVDRAKYHFALTNVRIDLDVLLTATPDKAKLREEKLRVIEADLVEAGQWLGIDCSESVLDKIPEPFESSNLEEKLGDSETTRSQDATQVRQSGSPVKAPHSIRASHLLDGMENPDLQRIEHMMSPTRIKSIKPIVLGGSRDRKYRVTTTNNDEYFVKIFSTRADGSPYPRTRNEIEKTVWAADEGFGPKVKAYDTEQGILITQYLTNEMGRWDDGRREPRLSTTLALMRALHSSEILGHYSSYSTEQATVYWGKELAKLSSQQRQLPLSQFGRKIIEASIDRLSDMPYRAVNIHGDFHQWNVMFAKGRAWLIDWPFGERGDAMEDAAFYAYRADIRGFDEFERILKRYDPVLMQADVDRAKCRFALMHVRVYIEVLLQSSLEKSKLKKERLQAIEEDLRQDAEWLGIEMVSPQRDMIVGEIASHRFAIALAYLRCTIQARAESGSGTAE
jgi:thiamine kinase-like enzyme